jgi:hypothetical protein
MTSEVNKTYPFLNQKPIKDYIFNGLGSSANLAFLIADLRGPWLLKGDLVSKLKGNGSPLIFGFKKGFFYILKA